MPRKVLACLEDDMCKVAIVEVKLSAREIHLRKLRAERYSQTVPAFGEKGNGCYIGSEVVLGSVWYTVCFLFIILFFIAFFPFPFVGYKLVYARYNCNSKFECKLHFFLYKFHNSCFCRSRVDMYSGRRKLASRVQNTILVFFFRLGRGDTLWRLFYLGTLDLPQTPSVCMSNLVLMLIAFDLLAKLEE